MSEDTQTTGTATTPEGTPSAESAAPAPAESGERLLGAGALAAGEPPAEQADSANPAQGTETPEPVYEFKAPEGVSVDEDTLGAFTETAKELELPPESAQKLLDKMSPVIAERTQQRLAQVMAESRKSWAEASRADAEFGGDELAKNLGVANQAVKTYGTPELLKLLNETGLGDHPEVLRTFYRIGKTLSEDRFVAGSGNGDSRLDARKLYAASNMNP